MMLDKQKFDPPSLEANTPKVSVSVKMLKRYKSRGNDPITGRNIISEIDKLSSTEAKYSEVKGQKRSEMNEEK